MSGWRSMQQGRHATTRRRIRVTLVRHTPECNLYTCTCHTTSSPETPR